MGRWGWIGLNGAEWGEMRMGLEAKGRESDGNLSSPYRENSESCVLLSVIHQMVHEFCHFDIVENGIGKNNPFLWLCFSHFCLFSVFVFGCFCNLQHRSLAEFTQP